MKFTLLKYSTLYTSLVLTLILISVLGFAGPAAAKTMILKQCLEAGMENNPALKASRFSLDAAGHGIKEARADFLPSISSGYSINNLASVSSKGPTETEYLDQDIRTFNINMTQVLYAGSRIFNSYERAKILEQIAMAEMDLERLELAYNIEITFFTLMKAKEDVITATESVNRLTESVKAAQAFFRKELVPYVDVLQAKVDLADAKDLLGLAANNVNRERVALFSLMDQSLDENIEFIDGQYNTLKKRPSFGKSLEFALENRPDIAALNYQLAVAGKDAKIAMGKYLPMVQLDIGYYDQDRAYDKLGTTITGSYDRDQRNRYWSTGIYATWDIFDGGRAWYGKEKYNSEAEKIKSLIQETKNLISTNIRRALYSMSEAEQRIASSVDALIAANEYYEREEKRLRAGISTIPSLLDAQDRLIRAQGNKTQAILDYQLATSELKFMTGEEKLQDG